VHVCEGVYECLSTHMHVRELLCDPQRIGEEREQVKGHVSCLRFSLSPPCSSQCLGLGDSEANSRA
jgi:hypothetical protein